MTKKTQKKLRKALTLISCAALLVCITVGVTVAYLTDSAEVKNTFTIGNVQITLDETIPAHDPVKNEYTETATRTTETANTNSYKILPGTTIAKDPTVTVKANSEDCYVRALVTITYKEAADTIAKLDWINWDSENWNSVGAPVTTKENGLITRTYEVRYKDEVVSATTDNVLPDIFTKVVIPNTLTNDELATLDNFKIDVVAQAIQADGFATADLAWAAWPTEAE